MDQKTFITLFRNNQQSMYLLAKRLLTSHEEAVDAVQEVMTRLWERRLELDEVKNIESYAMQMVKFFCFDRLKSKQASHLKIVHQTKDQSLNAQETLESEGDVAMVRALIAELPEQYQLIIQLRDIQQYDFESIEHILGMKPTAVRVALSRARKMLKEKIEQKYHQGTA
jgi:RNA polymerase sigma-70 factor (ECF subfamily)